MVGHSSGGYTATALAEQRPDVVTALVLINTGPRMEALIAAPEGAIEPSQWPHLTDEQLRQAASTAFSRPGYQPPQQVLDDVRGMTYHTFTTTMQASRPYIEQQALPDRLAPLGKPLLVIYGEDDRRWRSSYAADYHAVPGAQVEMLPGLGHSPLLEDPPRTAILLSGLHRGDPRRDPRPSRPSEASAMKPRRLLGGAWPSSFASRGPRRARDGRAAWASRAKLADRLTDSLFRRPSGWVARRFYRDPRPHFASFEEALAALELGLMTACWRLAAAEGRCSNERCDTPARPRRSITAPRWSR